MPHTPMRSDARKRRTTIIGIACELYRTTEPDAVTHDMVAEYADVGVATVYRNFPDRASLRLACATHLMDQLLELQTDIIADFPADPQAAWEDFVYTLVDFGVATLLPALAPDNLDDLPDEVKTLRTQATAQSEEILRLASDAGLIRPGIRPEQLIAGLCVVARPAPPAVESLSPDINSQLVDMLIDALR
ncbi:TetR/AcrR family transcriptional regulator [Corynebacterium renale]|uniref:TetR family transcriptional regulator n=1 Tax=Corynebacterium renale TaxID=1724 RepID=A0A2A9DNM4_9CORY|nr:TetR/AcrR family transcriptional regulator [Corynebacterium renale]PFG27572.1 TetR family transcriptional regulator [Corynebacterium renale]SQI23102.1 transcriptional regulator [Corynebacterium renale]